jgi:hypothetical protein
VLVSSEITCLEPIGEHRVESTAAGLRDAGVGDLARQCMLDRVLPIARDHRPPVASDEVALLEKVEVRLLPHEMNDRRGPEHPPRDGSGLECRLLGRRQPVDSRREHRVNGVRHREVHLARAEHPLSITPLEDTGVDELSHELLEKERIPLGSRDQEAAELVGEDRGNHLVEHPRRLTRGKRVESHDGRVPPASSPTRPMVLELGPRRRQQHDRRPSISHDPLEQIEEVVLGPVHVLDQENGGPRRRELVYECHHGPVELLARVERVERFRAAPSALSAPRQWASR